MISWPSRLKIGAKSKKGKISNHGARFNSSHSENISFKSSFSMGPPRKIPCLFFVLRQMFSITYPPKMENSEQLSWEKDILLNRCGKKVDFL